MRRLHCHVARFAMHVDATLSFELLLRRIASLFLFCFVVAQSFNMSELANSQYVSMSSLVDYVELAVKVRSRISFHFTALMWSWLQLVKSSDGYRKDASAKSFVDKSRWPMRRQIP